MTQMTTPPAAPVVRAGRRNDIYTVLALVALLVLIAGVAFIWYRSGQLFGTSNPFEVVKPAAAMIFPSLF